MVRRYSGELQHDVALLREGAPRLEAKAIIIPTCAIRARVAVAIVMLSAGTSCTPAAEQTHGHPATDDPAVVDSSFPPAMSELSFESGGSKLNGLMYVANGPEPHPTVVLLHGYAGNERNLDLAQAMRRAGMNVLYFNYRGTWGSGGEFSIVNAVHDAATAVSLARSAEWAEKYRSDPGRVALVGHSLGGFFGAIAMARDREIACLASVAGADLGPAGVAARADTSVRGAIAAALGKDMDMAGGPIRADARRVVEEFADSADAFLTPVLAPGLITRPLLLVAGERDEALPKAQHHDRVLAALRQAGATRLTEVVFDDDHSFSAHRIELARRLVDWLQAECWENR